MDTDYAKAYMTERLQEAENRRLIAISRRRPNEMSALTRLAELWLGRSSQPIGVARAVLATTGLAMEEDCCVA